MQKRTEQSPEGKYNTGVPQIICRKLIADLETPVSTFLKLNLENKPAVLLESVQGGESRGRYSIIALDPDIIFEANGTEVTITRGKDRKVIEDNPLEVLHELIEEVSFELPKNLPPMASGLFGYFGFETVAYIEKLPCRAGAGEIPDIGLMRPLSVIIFDSVADEIMLLRLITYSQELSYSQALAEAEGELDNLENKISRQLVGHRAAYNGARGEINYTAKQGRNRYMKLVEKAKEYIVAGDIFQVVLSESFEADFYLPPFSLYRALRHLNPSPFLVYLSFADFQLVASSPEIMARVRDSKLTVRPIAGTRKRGASAEEDKSQEEDLKADEKELAEHLMLVDLGRNDAARVCKPGTVKVTEMMKVEYYSHVLHLVSNVEGSISDGCTALDALLAAFPAGTLSGAPKIRAMEIISELEADNRGFYGGCMGYIGAGGDMDTCITIRTALIKRNKLFTRAGAGIVTDSIAANEYEECLNKAGAIFRAAFEADKFR